MAKILYQTVERGPSIAFSPPTTRSMGTGKGPIALNVMVSPMPSVPSTHFPLLSPLHHVSGMMAQLIIWDSVCVSERSLYEDPALGVKDCEGEQKPVGSRSGSGEAFGAESVEASSQLFSLSGSLMERRREQKLRGTCNRGEKKELWETCPRLIICSSFKKSSLHVSYVLGCLPPGMPVMRGHAAPGLGLCPFSPTPRSRSSPTLSTLLCRGLGWE